MVALLPRPVAIGCRTPVGWMGYAFQYVVNNGGVDTEEAYRYTSYPMEAKTESCRFNVSAVGATASGYVELPEGDEEALKVAVATVGPISVALKLTNDYNYYKQGVFYDPTCGDVKKVFSHAVLVVGYGSDPVGGDFWIVKNSVGTWWGESGYMRIERKWNNHCGIASMAVYPLVEMESSESAVQKKDVAAQEGYRWLPVNKFYYCMALFVLFLVFAYALFTKQRTAIAVEVKSAKQKVERGFRNPSFMV